MQFHYIVHLFFYQGFLKTYLVLIIFHLIDIIFYLNQSREFPQYFNHSIIIDYSCVIPCLFNFELFSLYKEDKEKWFYILKKVINIQPSGNPLEDIKKLGLTPNFKVSEICDELRSL